VAGRASSVAVLAVTVIRGFADPWIDIYRDELAILH